MWGGAWRRRHPSLCACQPPGLPTSRPATRLTPCTRLLACAAALVTAGHRPSDAALAAVAARAETLLPDRLPPASLAWLLWSFAHLRAQPPRSLLRRAEAALRGPQLLALYAVDGADVARLCWALAELKYYSGGWPGGWLDRLLRGSKVPVFAWQLRLPVLAQPALVSPPLFPPAPLPPACPRRAAGRPVCCAAQHVGAPAGAVDDAGAAQLRPAGAQRACWPLAVHCSTSAAARRRQAQLVLQPSTLTSASSPSVGSSGKGQRASGSAPPCSAPPCSAPPCFAPPCFAPPHRTSRPTTCWMWLPSTWLPTWTTATTLT